jgi:hypothetical protein
MVVLVLKCEKDPGIGREGSMTASKPKGTYAVLFFVGILWITSTVAGFVDWPKDSEGVELKKRGFDWSQGIDNGAVNGPAIGCIVMDFVFM